MREITGIGASGGIAVARACCLTELSLIVNEETIDDPEVEVDRLKAAIKTSVDELEVIEHRATERIGSEEAAIFQAHRLIITDPELFNIMKEKITTKKMNAELALEEAIDSFLAMFEAMDDPYMRERAADIRDVRKRLLVHLLGVKRQRIGDIQEEVILVAKDISPSQAAQLNPKFIKGFVTDIGGETSHSAILARSLGIPAIVGTGDATKKIEEADLLIIDGAEGKLFQHPPEDLISEYETKQKKFIAEKEEWAKLAYEKTVTADGKEVHLDANIGTPAEVEQVIKAGGEGIGLYRTEFLYIGRDELPTEEEQFETYKTVLEGMGSRTVIVRTLDIGGDKQLPYLHLRKEENPFLGIRGIRFCLEEQGIFRTQLRALLRASVYGNLKIMFPMVATLTEFQQAKTILTEEREALLAKGTPIADKIDIGITVEVPAACLQAEQFAKEADFLSIGSNDLIQYTMAADRMNERVSYLYQPYHPAVLRLVKMAIDAAEREDKLVGLCGSMAEDELAIPLLLGLGLERLSINAASNGRVRAWIRSLDSREMETFAKEALQMGTAEEVIEAVKRKFAK